MRTTCAEVCQNGGCCARIVIFFCSVVIGFASLMAIGGIVLLLYTNPRDALVASYNVVGSSYASNDQPAFTKMNFSLMASATASAASSASSTWRQSSVEAQVPVPIQGSTEGVAPFTSTTFTVAGVPRSVLPLAWATAALQGSPSGTPNIASLVNTSNSSSSVNGFSSRAFRVAPSILRSVTLHCADTGCGKSCDCGSGTMFAKCQSTYNGSYRDLTSDGSCSGKDACGVCDYTAFVTHICVPVVFDALRYAAVASDKYAACDYPFTDTVAVYDSPSPLSTVTVEFRCDNDPYMEAQRLTAGTMNFGWSDTVKYGVGSALLVAGVVGGTLAMVLLVYIFRNHKANAQNLALQRVAMERAASAAVVMGGGVVQQGVIIAAPDPTATHVGPAAAATSVLPPNGGSYERGAYDYSRAGGYGGQRQSGAYPFPSPHAPHEQHSSDHRESAADGAGDEGMTALRFADHRPPTLLPSDGADRAAQAGGRAARPAMMGGSGAGKVV